MDELNLGMLQAGDFFGELSLLPLAAGWRHQHRLDTETGDGDGCITLELLCLAKINPIIHLQALELFNDRRG